MNATVNSVKFNEQLGKYKVTKLSVVTDKGDDKDYNIFSNAPFHNVVATLKKGDSIELRMEKNGKYWNVADVVKIEGQAKSQETGGSYKAEASGSKDIAISRAVALKAAVELYCAMIAAGMTKKTLKPDAAQEEVFALCKRFEGYCTLADDLSDLASDMSSLATGGDDGEYEETPFE